MFLKIKQYELSKLSEKINNQKQKCKKMTMKKNKSIKIKDKIIEARDSIALLANKRLAMKWSRNFFDKSRFRAKIKCRMVARIFVNGLSVNGLSVNDFSSMSG